MTKHQTRIVKLQAQIKIAKETLEKIAHGCSEYRASMIADEALEKLERLEIGKEF